MVLYKLIAIVISATSGDLIYEYEALPKPMSAEKCNLKQMEKGITYPKEGQIKVYECRPVEVV